MVSLGMSVPVPVNAKLIVIVLPNAIPAGGGSTT